MDSKDAIVPGSLWTRDTVSGNLPPLIPPVPPDGLDWDTELFAHSQLDVIGPSERRHSGWEAVERRWTHNDNALAISKRKKEAPTKELLDAMSRLRPSLSLPPPQLEVDFRMRIVLNSNVATVAVGTGFKKWTTFTEGSWSGLFGSGSVVGGGQESIDIETGKSLATQVESTYKLKTIDEPPALIECKARGWRTGPEDIMQALQQPDSAQAIDPRQYRHRIIVTMKTNDERYADKLNVEMWVGTCLWRGSEVIYDAYRIR